MNSNTTGGSGRTTLEGACSQGFGIRARGQCSSDQTLSCSGDFSQSSGMPSWLFAAVISRGTRAVPLWELSASASFNSSSHLPAAKESNLLVNSDLPMRPRPQGRRNNMNGNSRNNFHAQYSITSSLPRGRANPTLAIFVCPSLAKSSLANPTLAKFKVLVV